jgi:lipoprotein-anchoring transpeptidase ErfK/SrfK
VVSGGNLLGVYDMSHDNVAAGDLYIGNGAYSFADTRRPHKHSSKQKDKNGIKVDSENGSYGPYGIFRLGGYPDFSHHPGIGIHSGRVNKGGYCAMTAGCFRTTDEGMGALMAGAGYLPLNTFYVVNEPYDTHVARESGGF